MQPHHVLHIPEQVYTSTLPMLLHSKSIALSIAKAMGHVEHQTRLGRRRIALLPHTGAGGTALKHARALDPTQP